MKVYGTRQKLPIFDKSLVATAQASPEGGRGVLLGILGGVVPDPISDQTSKIHTRFPTLAEIMSSLLRVERKQKISSNAFRIHIFLFSRSYLFGIEKTSMFKHSRSFLENYTRFQTKMGKSIPVIRPCIRSLGKNSHPMC